MIPTRHTVDLLPGMWMLLQSLGRVPRRGKRHAEGVGAFTGTPATTLIRLKPYDPESKGVVERRTDTSRPPSCPAARSTRQLTSTPSSLAGWRSRTPGWCARSRPDRSTGSTRTEPRCCRRHRWHLRWGRPTGPGWDATTTSASTAVTTPSTSPRSAGSSTCTPTWPGSRSVTKAGADPAHVVTAKVLREQFQLPRWPTRAKPARHSNS